jgi:hypothetical protein
VLDLEPLWRLLIILSAAGVIPLLLVAGWAAHTVRDSCTALLVRSWWRGHRRQWQRRHGQHYRGQHHPGRIS